MIKGDLLKLSIFWNFYIKKCAQFSVTSFGTGKKRLCDESNRIIEFPSSNK